MWWWGNLNICDTATTFSLIIYNFFFFNFIHFYCGGSAFNPNIPDGATRSLFIVFINFYCGGGANLNICDTATTSSFIIYNFFILFYCGGGGLNPNIPDAATRFL